MARIPFPRTRRSNSAPLSALRNRAGRSLSLTRPLRSGGLRKRPSAPEGWRNIAAMLADGKGAPEKRINGWLLVLAAKKIPHTLFPSGNYSRLYVPPVYEGVALHEILAFEREGSRPSVIPPVRRHEGAILVFLGLLLFWHGLRFQWFSGLSLPVPPFPFFAEGWPPNYGLDVYRTRVLHEWWRCITALTVHADDAHLLSNLCFGLFFFIPLCRRAGAGFALFLSVAAGILGNAANALTREANVLSIGFSTALFGAVGGLCAVTAFDMLRSHGTGRGSQGGLSAVMAESARRLLLPLGAGLALLGFLGGGGSARTDYAAHIWGFCMGLLVGGVMAPLDAWLRRQPERKEVLAQAALFLAPLLLMAACWGYVLFAVPILPWKAR